MNSKNELMNSKNEFVKSKNEFVNLKNELVNLKKKSLENFSEDEQIRWGNFKSFPNVCSAFSNIPLKLSNNLNK